MRSHGSAPTNVYQRRLLIRPVRQHAWTQRQAAEALGSWARVGLNRVALVEPTGPVQRFEWPHVGDLLHVDLKRLGRVVGIGYRIQGDRRRRARRVGWQFLHVTVDDATRLTYAEVLPADDAAACAAFLRRTLTWFRRRGVRIRRLLTDNAMAYRARAFCGVCRAWAVRQPYTRPYRPQTNGTAERFIQTLLREWAYRVPYRSSARRTAALRPYLRFYNPGVRMRASAGARHGCVSKRLPNEQPL